MAALKKNLINLLDYPSQTIASLISRAEELKRCRLVNEPEVMKNRTGVLIFEKPSLRTRITFETAIHELGGYSINLSSEMVQMGRRESVEDVARNLQRWVHLLVVRTYSHETLMRLDRSCSVPVINALTDSYHPCQALACALTIKQTFGEGKNIRVVFIGDGNNVCASLMIICAKLGYDFVFSCPSGYEPSEELVKSCKEIARKNDCSITLNRDPRDAVARASLIYTDVWASMGQENQKEKRKRDFTAFQINEKLVSRAPSDVQISHCLPAHRGEEIASEVLDSPRSRAFDEAENRLHVQKAVIVHLFS